MKIVYITSAYLPHIGGLENCVASVAEYFATENDVIVITADTEAKTVIEENINDIRTIRLPAYSISGLVFLKSRKYKNLILREIKNADIVHHNDCKFIYRFLVNKKTKCSYKLFLSSHGFIFHTKSHQLIKKVYFKRIVAAKSKYVNNFICVSEQDKQIADIFGITNTSVIYPGVNIHKFENLNTSEENANEFVYWGRIAPNKGIVESIKKLAQLKTDYHVNFIGKCEDSEYMKLIEKTMKEYNCFQNISFLGPQPDESIKQILSKSSYILMPSLHEGFGMTLAECLLSGKKIIANTNSSYCQILTAVNASEYLFDFEAEESDLNQFIENINKMRLQPQNVEQYSNTEMFKRIKEVYSR